MKLRVTATFEYDADPEGTDLETCRRDQEVWTDIFKNQLEDRDLSNIEVKVAPVNGRYLCCVDCPLEDPLECVLLDPDYTAQDCNYAKEGMDPHECQYYKIVEVKEAP